MHEKKEEEEQLKYEKEEAEKEEAHKKWKEFWEKVGINIVSSFAFVKHFPLTSIIV